MVAATGGHSMAHGLARRDRAASLCSLRRVHRPTASRESTGALVELGPLPAGFARMFAKLELRHPCGSVKDRLRRARGW